MLRWMRNRTDKATGSDGADVRACREKEQRQNVTVEAPPGAERALGAQSRNERSTPKAVWPWLVVRRWIAANMFAPTWIARQWQRPGVGYFLAVLAALLAVGAAAGLIQVFPTFAYPGIIPLVAIASVALSWGARPSLAATAVGAAGLDLLVLPPRFVWHLESLDDVVEVGLFVVVGVVIAAGASRTERARRTAQDLADQLDAVIDAMADGVYLCNRVGRIQKTNGALRHLLALDDQPAHSSQPLHDQAALFMPRDSEGRLLPHEKWPVVRVLKGETLTGAHAVDMRIRTLDGRELDLNTSGAPMRDADGRVTGGVLVARDVTERRRLERERLLRERAEAHAQEWALREANQRMDEFVSLAAHELKTPLAAIPGL